MWCCCLFPWRAFAFVLALFGVGILFPPSSFSATDFLTTYHHILQHGTEDPLLGLDPSASAPSRLENHQSREASFRKAVRVPVMSFNIRLDCLEADPENHFTKRVHRLSSFFNKTRPMLVGLQEPFSGQLLHLQSLLPPSYRALGFTGNDHFDRAHPLRVNDFQTGILFDSERLELVESDHIWLSEQPRVPNSKSWGSVGIRTATVGAFRFKQGCEDPEKKNSEMGLTSEKSPPKDREVVDVIHFNTHLDVWSAMAREQQAQVLAQQILKWHKKYPHAGVIVTGDFNTANGHLPHKTLVSLHESKTGLGKDDAEDAFTLNDAWDMCEQSAHCQTPLFLSSTFHGWLGTAVDKYVARFIHFALQTLHGAGIGLPHEIRLGGVKHLANILWQLPHAQWSNAMPGSFSRIHVDWILASSHWDVELVSLAEVRDSEFSSDHFPVVAILEKKNP